MATRYKLIHGTLRRLRQKLPDADTDALRTLADVDAAIAILLDAMASGKFHRDLLASYTRLIDQRISLLTRLRLLPPLPRAKVSDDDESPEAQTMRERVEREQRVRLREAGVIKD